MSDHITVDDISLSHYHWGIIRQASGGDGLYLPPNRYGQGRIDEANKLVTKGLMELGTLRGYPARYALTVKGHAVWQKLRTINPVVWEDIYRIWTKLG